MLVVVASFANLLAITSTDYNNYLNNAFGSTLAPIISAAYPISSFSATIAPALYAIATIIGDAEYTCPTRRALKTSLTTKLGTYTYLWNHTPSCPWTPSIPSSLLPLLGPTHTSELAFVFREMSNLPQPNGTCEFSASEQILSLEIVTAWQSMSKNGYPTLANGIKWPDWSQEEQGVIFNQSLAFDTINGTQCDFWEMIQTLTSTSTTTSTTSRMMTSISTSTSMIITDAATSCVASTMSLVLATFLVLLHM
jgi:carboxylesterase type B